jgi:hypothetical protein
MKTNMKTNNKNKSKVVNSHVKVTKGVYVTPSGTYVVRPTVNGKRLHVSFSNKKNAISYYKSTVNS